MCLSNVLPVIKWRIIMKFANKLFVLSLVAVMMLTCSISVFANAASIHEGETTSVQEGTAVTASCSHVAPNTGVTTDPSGWQSAGSSGCKRVYTNTAKCVKCGAQFSWTTLSNTIYPHNNSIYQATCNGIKRTFYFKCTKCGYTHSEINSCPGADHTGKPCAYLPV